MEQEEVRHGSTFCLKNDVTMTSLDLLKNVSKSISDAINIFFKKRHGNNEIDVLFIFSYIFLCNLLSYIPYKL